MLALITPSMIALMGASPVPPAMHSKGASGSAEAGAALGGTDDHDNSALATVIGSLGGSATAAAANVSEDSDRNVAIAVAAGAVGSGPAAFADGEKFGELRISRGGVDWWPRDAKTRGELLTWEQFAARMART